MENYKIVKPFTIIDIYDKLPLNCEEAKTKFKELLEEGWSGVDYFTVGFSGTRYPIDHSYILRSNLPWLEGQGFIESKEVYLKDGMRLMDAKGYSEYVVKKIDSIFVIFYQSTDKSKFFPVRNCKNYYPLKTKVSETGFKVA